MFGKIPGLDRFATEQHGSMPPVPSSPTNRHEKHGHGVIKIYGRTALLSRKCTNCGDSYFVVDKSDRCCELEKPKPPDRRTFRVETSLPISFRSNITEVAKVQAVNRSRLLCTYCDKDISNEGGHFDHVMPASAGGSGDPLNVVYACVSCNLRKSDKVFDSVAAARDYLRNH